MPLLIILLLAYGGFVLGGYVASGAIRLIAIVFVAPGLIYEKLFARKTMTGGPLFLVVYVVSENETNLP
jgi:hypothetical protein